MPPSGVPRKGLIHQWWAALSRRLGVGGVAGLERDLVRKVRGDTELAERLVALEMRRAPDGSRKEWLEEAIRRLERDHR
ncbi:MAG: hypothetical protein ACRDG5_06995 [Anaerolineales bacterium]